MPLKDYPFKAVYRSEDDSLLRDFYLPALKASNRYDRAVGFFSAGMLSYAAQGLSAFIVNAGEMRLIFGGDLTPEDAEAIQRGYDLRPISDRLGAEIVAALESIEELLYNKRLEALAYMIAAGRLEIKVALRTRGMYHEKIGIFRDSEHTVVFQGSANETTSALLSDFNFESINVFPSWRTELADHAQPYIDGFERLWVNKSKGTLVLDFPDAAKEKLLRIASRAIPPMTIAVEIAMAARQQNEERAAEQQLQVPVIPTYFAGEPFKVRDHQAKALHAWKGSAFRGILAHATGSGKTVTAIYGAARVFEVMRQLFLVVAVPYVNLAEQWLRVLRSFNITALACYGSVNRWSQSLAETIDSFRLGGSPFACVVVVDRTLVGGDFQSAIARIPGEQLLFVGDECHHHASIVAKLPEHARLRLGLSATPEEALTGEVAPQLIAYYGSVVDRFGLADALEAKLLTPYEYHVVPVELSPPEIDEYVEITGELAKLVGRANSGQGLNDHMQRLLFQRARLLGRAETKLVVLRSLLEKMKPQPLTLFYCGDGSTEDDITGESVRQVEAVSRILYEHHWRPAIFTAAEDKKEREAILRQFSIGDIDALVAIRCLDEGIDIPACRAAYILASAQNPRQYVQRRGRVLRRSINKDRALVTDLMVTVPPGVGMGETYARNLLRSELRRVAEFAHLAVNSVDAYRELRELLEVYDLVHLLVD